MHTARYVHTSVGRCFVETAGDGPPVLCLHTAGQSGAQYAEVVLRLPEFGFTAVVPDLPGHGRSEPARGGPLETIAAYRGVCVEILDALGVDRFYVAGVSVGGKLALDFAVFGGDRVLGAVALEAEARNEQESVRALDRQREGSAMPASAERTWFGTLASVGSSVPVERAERIAWLHRREDPLITVLDRTAWATHDVRAELAGVRCPIHLVAGADDLWISTENVRATAAAIPGARCTVLEGVGHYPAEELEDFPERLAGWLRALPARGSPHEHGEHGRYGDATTLPGLLAEQARRRPDATAAAEGDGGRRLTYAELRDAAQALARRLHDAGVRPGDVVAVWLPNWLEALVWEFAVARLGGVVLGVNTRYNVHELAHLVALTDPACVALPDELLGIDFVGRLREALATGPGSPARVPTVAVTGPGRHPADASSADVGAGAFGWSLAADPAAPAGGDEPPATDPGAEVNLFTTSGSTGLPKLASHDQAAVVRHARGGAEAFGITGDDVLLGVLPLFGVFGFNSVLAALAGGASVVLEAVFDADRCLEHMAGHGVTLTVGGDDLHGRLLDAWTAHPRDLSAWRRAGLADFSGRSLEVARWADREAGAAVCGVYGSSEVFALTAVRPVELRVDDRVRGGGTVVSPGIEVRVRDLESGADPGPDGVGELQFRGYVVTGPYRGNAEATAASRTADGWFRSGDLGTVEGPGQFTYLCRAGDALRLHGFLVEPAEIEQFLLERPAVVAARVVGAHRDDGTGVAVAFVVPADGTGADGRGADGRGIDGRAIDGRGIDGRGIDEHDLLAHCRAGLARFKVPERIVVLDELPTTPGTNGDKIRNSVLREWARDAVAGS